MPQNVLIIADSKEDAELKTLEEVAIKWGEKVIVENIELSQ